MKTISQRQWEASQSLDYEVVVISTLGERYKVRIRRDSYDNQSFIRGYIYSPARNEWSLLVTKDITLSPVKNQSRYARRHDWEVFEHEATEIIKEMRLIAEE